MRRILFVILLMILLVACGRNNDFGTVDEKSIEMNYSTLEIDSITIIQSGTMISFDDGRNAAFLEICKNFLKHAEVNNANSIGTNIPNYSLYEVRLSTDEYEDIILIIRKPDIDSDAIYINLDIHDIEGFFDINYITEHAEEIDNYIKSNIFD